MAANVPTAKNLADLYTLAPLDWDDVRGTLETNLTQAPGTGGPGHHTFWLSTLDADGRPHMTAVGAFWVDGRYYFSGGPRSRKIRNIERDSRCACDGEVAAWRGAGSAIACLCERNRDIVSNSRTQTVRAPDQARGPREPRDGAPVGGGPAPGHADPGAEPLAHGVVVDSVNVRVLL